MTNIAPRSARIAASVFALCVTVRFVFALLKPLAIGSGVSAMGGHKRRWSRKPLEDEMKKLVAWCLPFLFFCACVFAQTKPVDPPAVPQLTADQKVAVLSAQHKLDDVEKQMKDLDTSFQQIQTQAKTQYQTLADKENTLKAALDLAKSNTFAAAKVDQTKYDIDMDALEFKLKPTTAQAAPPAPPPAPALK